MRRERDSKSVPPAAPVSRRSFLKGVGGASALAVAGAAPAAKLFAAEGAGVDLLDSVESFQTGKKRRQATYQLRISTARHYHQQPIPDHLTNGDEGLYADRRASFSKTLPHDGLGEVDGAVFDQFVSALDSMDPDALNAVPLAPGAVARLVGPQGAFTYQLEGEDSHGLTMPPAPAFAGPVTAAEMGEVYWKALTRDVSFRDWGSDPRIAAAVSDLNGFSSPVGPKDGGQVTLGTVFRGDFGGELAGPYLSQFLWLPFNYGPLPVEQRYRSPVAGSTNDFMTDFGTWLGVQRGLGPQGAATVFDAPRYIANGRDLAEYVHADFTYQAYLNAALILVQMGPTATFLNNPYRNVTNQAAFTSFGPPDVFDMVTRVATQALRTAWYQKWMVHRRLRPEVYGGRVDVHVEGLKSYDVHADFLNSDALARVESAYGSSLLPMAYPEGSPSHPAYPAGHATIAGACVTILKAFFDEGFVLPHPVEASADGSTLEPWTGADLTVGGELNKLGSNISLGRDWAGVHYRSDGADGMRLGEAVALSMLRDYARIHSEAFGGFELTTFDGDHLVIGAA